MTHIVEFENWCKNCKYKDNQEEDNPCYLCLDEPVNEDSKRPVYFKESDSYRKSKEKEKKKNAR